MSETTPLGMIYLPANPGTPVGRFEFIVDRDAGERVEIGVPVAADTSEGVVVGAVIDMRTVGEAKDPMSVDLGSRYESEFIAQIPEVMLATVQVFHSPTMRPVRSGLVRSATAEEMLKATGYYDIKWPVAAGVVQLVNGDLAKVCFDGHALLGPESAHMMVGGLSGQASKTSYMGAVLKSAMEAGKVPGEGVAALIFNVKGEDLIFMDEPPAAGYELQESDLAIYKAMGVEPTPFEDVTVYAPGMPGGRGTRSPRVDAIPLRWDLATVWPYLRYFLPYVADDEKVQSFLADFRTLLLENPNPLRRIDTFGKLDDWFEETLTAAEEVGEDGKTNSMAWRSHHKATVWRIRRMLMGLVPRCAGLLTKESSTLDEDVQVRGWTPGQIIVVDIAGLHSDIQGIVIARTVERLMKAAEDGEMGDVSHLMVFADEANTLVPSQGSEAAQVRKTLSRITKEGRYLGIQLTLAGQSLSKVEEMITSQASTRALGRTADIELASGTYGRLSAGITERIATMPKGSMMLWHYTFRAPLMVKFPRPAWRTGKAKAGTTSYKPRPKTTDSLGLGSKSVDRLTEGLTADQIEKIVAEHDDPVKAREALEKARVPDMSKQVVDAKTANTFDADDPFGLDDM